MAPKPPERRGPAFGAVDGVKKDLAAAKAARAAGKDEGADGTYDPRGAGTAWTHNFLNQKPWHPLNFRNQARVFEAEQESYELEKRKEAMRAEADAESQYLKTLALLPTAEAERYRERQSVSWLYMKPPGYDAALERSAAAAGAAAAGGAGGAAGGAGDAAAAAPGGEGQEGPQQAQQQQAAAPPRGEGTAPPGQPQAPRQPQRDGKGINYMANVIAGMKAVAQKGGLELKRGPGGTPPRGQVSSAANQQFVVAEVDSEEEEAAIRLALMPEAERRRLAEEAERLRQEAAREVQRAQRAAEKAAEQEKLAQAKAFLRAAGLALPSSSSSGSGGSSSSSGSEDEGSGRSGGEAGGRDGPGSARRRRKGKRVKVKVTEHKRRHKALPAKKSSYSHPRPPPRQPKSSHKSKRRRKD